MTDPAANDDNPGKPPMSKMTSSDHPLGSAGFLDNAAFSAPTRPGILANFDDFEILRQIGAGGMGIVLLARNPAIDTLVAIKVLRPELAKEPRAVRRFL